MEKEDILLSIASPYFFITLTLLVVIFFIIHIEYVLKKSRMVLYFILGHTCIPSLFYLISLVNLSASTHLENGSTNGEVMTFSDMFGMLLRKTIIWNRIFHVYCFLCLTIQLTMLITFQKLRPFWYCCLISWPGYWFVGFSFLAAFFSIIFNRYVMFPLGMLGYDARSFALFLDIVVCVLATLGSSFSFYETITNFTNVGEEVIEIDLSRNATKKRKIFRVGELSKFSQQETPIPDSSPSSPNIYSMISRNEVHRSAINSMGGSNAGAFGSGSRTGDANRFDELSSTTGFNGLERRNIPSQFITLEKQHHQLFADQSEHRNHEHRNQSHRHSKVSRKYLRIFQITDAHLGPFMSVYRLFSICRDIVDKVKPDLVLLTGDLETVETRKSPEALVYALSPLSELKGRVFACHGNHDYERYKGITDALTKNGITILEDDAVYVKTAVGIVQIIGSKFTFGQLNFREKQLSQLLKNYPVDPRDPQRPRILLLHNPSDFQFIPKEACIDLVLSGHYHGGQLGLLRFGWNVTFLSFLCKMVLYFKPSQYNKRKWCCPDNGLWMFPSDTQNISQLYVHRGTGHYGFPLRIGVPNEVSILKAHFYR